LFKDKNIKYLSLLPLIIIAFIVFKLVNNYQVILRAISVLFSIISPFIWAIGIAYFLNPLMKYFETKLKIKRLWSLLLVYILVFGIISLLLTNIIPIITRNLLDLADNTPKYIEDTQIWIIETADRMEWLVEYGVINYITQYVDSIFAESATLINSLLNILVTKAIQFTSGFLKFLIGIVVSVYLLKDKEGIIAYVKRMFLAFLSPKKYSETMAFFTEVNEIFGQFLIGKTIDSLIIAIICFIGLNLLNIRFAVLISTIIGVTNMIPYFGPFIGMIPAFIITVLYSPVKALWVLIFIIILQQFDGLYLGPKILGEKVGLSPLLIIFAITLGGGLAGVLGMFLGVPIMAVIRVIVSRFVNRRIQNKKTTISTENNEINS
jgi:predicted PurR-regulated permease PerM